MHERAKAGGQKSSYRHSNGFWEPTALYRKNRGQVAAQNVRAYVREHNTFTKIVLLFLLKTLLVLRCDLSAGCSRPDHNDLLEKMRTITTLEQLLEPLAIRFGFPI